MEGFSNAGHIFENILQGITDSVLLLSKDFTILWANEAFQNQTGYKREEIIGSHCYRLTHHQEVPCQLPHDLCPIVEALENGRAATTIHTHFDKEWNKIFVEVSAYPMKDERGEILQFVYMYRDITEMKSLEEELRSALVESQKRQAEILALLEGSRAILEYHDFHSSARSIFDSCKKLIGATSGYIALLSKDGTENEVLFLDSGGLPCSVDPRLPMPIRGLRGEAYHNVKTVYHNDFSGSEWVKFMPEGHVRLDNVLFAPMVVEGKTVGLLGIANKPEGFTENDARMASAFAELAAIALTNKRAEEELYMARDELEIRVKERTQEIAKVNEELFNSEKKYRVLVEQASDGIFILDQQLNIIDINSMASQMFGFAKEELLRLNVRDLTLKDDFADVSLRQKRILSGETVVFERKALRKDETLIDVEISAKMLEDGVVQAILRDITERKQTESRINATNAILKLLIKKSSRKEYLDSVVELIQSWSGCCCVGIRGLDRYGNIPYESYLGFSNEFWESENWLSVKEDQCACIRVILGKLEPQDFPVITQDGSFRCDNTTKFINGLSENEKAQYRGVCIRSGFKSVAVIPIRYKEDVIGAIHLTDEREGMVPLKTVEFIESISPLIGEAVHRFSTEEELMKSYEQLRTLSAHLQSVREEERTNIAREIHDELGQVLTALKIDVSMLANKLHPDSKLLEKTESMIKRIDETIQTVKRICTELRPTILDHFGLSAAIEWQSGEFENRTGIKCGVSFEPREIILDQDLTTAVFRIFQEALTNVARHARATEVNVSLRLKDGKVMLEVKDNGKGITEKEFSNPQSFGIIGIKERAIFFGGDVKINGIRDKGTTLTVCIPLRKKEELHDKNIDSR